MLRHLGLPVAVGIAPSKVLAKIANRIAKRDPTWGGVFDLGALDDPTPWLEEIAVEDIWGVGLQWSRWCHLRGISNARILRDLPPGELRRRWGVVGLRLQRELQGEQTKFGEVRQKLLEAQLAENLEAEQKGERFTLIEPPFKPQKPVKPNRPAIVALGLLGALAAAIGLMVLLELLDTRIRGRRQVVSLAGAPPLAIIPWVADEEKPSRFAFWKRQPAGAAAGA